MRKADAGGRNGKRIEAGARASVKNLKALLLAVLLVAVSGWPPKANADSNSTSEYDVKAAFLFHFAQFVEWPEEAFLSAESPLTYCTVGADVFRGALDESVKGKRIGNRPLRVLHLREREAINSCQVLFIGTAEKGRQTEELASANGRPMLTVGETAEFAQKGGMIGFCLEEKKVRFEINVGAAEKARLKISAKLLALAKTVLGSPRGD
jgi:YfiR/HmsC-like